MKTLLFLVSIIIICYALFLLFAATLMNLLIFPAPSPTYADDGKIIFIDDDNGNRIAASYRPAKDAKYCVVYAHGNREDLGTIAELMDDYAARGYAVLAYDYVGYGLSTHAFPTPDKLRSAAEAAFKYARENLKFEESQIVLVGYSLGSAAACHTAKMHPDVRALVLVGGFASIPYAVLPIDPLPWNLLANASILAELKNTPTLLIHGTRDATVAPRNARRNFESAASKTRLLWLEGYAHGNLFKSPHYWDEIKYVIENNNYEKSACITVQ